ncbi:MAG TPA: HEAT repeat domain-containing protein [Candidatus Acidoferrales bacterium]|nr:HEAT repeat domain-containing protein [Candidatus Acidoferrales bacterium]
MITTALKVVLALEAVWAAVLLALLGVTLAVLSRNRKRRLAALAAGSAIQEAVALHLSGNNDLTQLRSLAKTHPEAVEAGVLAFQSTVRGTTRLAELAVGLGLVERWCEAARSGKPAQRKRAFSRIAAMAQAEPVRLAARDVPVAGLNDSDAQVRLEAARAMVCSEDPRQVAQVFEAMLRDAPLNRMLLAPMLRRYAAGLCSTAIPKALAVPGIAPPDTGRLLNLLRLLVSWECSLPLLVDLRPLAEHPEPAVRLETMRLLAQVPTSTINRDAILAGMSDRDPAVAMAAVATVGRLKLPDAVPQAASCLKRGVEGLAQAAATVLLEMGPEGRCALARFALEGQVGNPDPIADPRADPVASMAVPAALELARPAEVSA